MTDVLTETRPRPVPAILVIALLLLLGIPAPAQSARPVSFARDVRPILSDHCFRCHGPDRHSRQADLRLDRQHSVLRDRDGKRIVTPGRPNSSELMRRISTHAIEEVMPPVDSGLVLEQSEIEMIRRWIAEGAAWEKHWAYLSPQRPDLPDVAQTGWPRNAIDSFVLAKLEKEGLTPSVEAPRHALARRWSLDITGLPPAPGVVAEFTGDPGATADEQFVNNLLMSQHYGERMALPWLEASRYADTSGYQEDYGRSMYPWRTWVINAFNENMPFDQFVTEQMAGDLLPDATQEQILATGFHRNHRINQELGSISDEFLVEYAIDRLETVGMLFLGTTIGCARCHDHKYDPITQREFYEFYAFLNNNDDDGIDQQSRFGFCKPFIEYPPPEGRAALSAVRTQLEELKSCRSLDDSAAEARAFNEWQMETEAELPLGVSSWQLIGPFPHPQDSKKSGFEFSFLPDAGVDLKAQHGTLQWQPKPDWVDGPHHNVGGEFTTYYLHRNIDVPYDIQLDTLISASDALQIRVNGEVIIRRLEGRKNTPDPEPVILPLRKGSNEIRIKLSNASFIQLFSFEVKARRSVPPNVYQVLTRTVDDRTEDDHRNLYTYFHGQRVKAVEKDVAALRRTFPKVMVMAEREDVRPAHLLVRGSYANRGEQVRRDTPAVLPPFPPGEPRDRLGLARWLTTREHPLLARVTVNRFWQMYFGTGLVKTTEDFGAQGEWPSHPELLDWLAVEFMESGWDVRHIQRLIVSSATYRQSSQSTSALNERDPDNRLLARGPRFRLRPHFIRDQALAFSGLLNSTLGGSSVKPYQPPGLWSDVSNLLLVKEWYNTNRFTQDHGDKLYRRSLYTFWKRAIPPPNMSVFDAGSREICSVRNEITNTPMQAMNLLNGVTYIEASRHLAHRILTNGGPTTSGRLNLAMEIVASRRPTEGENKILTRALERHVSVYSEDPHAAQELLTHGESPVAGNHDPVEHAAWTQVALMLLNLDEVISKQ